MMRLLKLYKLFQMSTVENFEDKFHFLVIRRIKQEGLIDVTHQLYF